MDQLMKDAARRIEQHRKKELRIKVLHEGQPVAYCPVDVSQLNHQFLFGANCHEANSFKTEEDNARYTKLFTDIFNFATIDFYWGWYEDIKDTRKKENRMALVNWCLENKLAIIGHCIVWHYSKIVPEWLYHVDKSKVEGLILKRIEDVVENFKDYIKQWTLVNEMTSTKAVHKEYDNPISDWFEEKGVLQAVKASIDTALRKDPKALVLINDFNVNNPKRALYINLIEELLENKVPLGAIGIQAHMHSYAWTMEEVWNVCNTFGKYGLPIHFVEISIVSGKAKKLDFFTSDNEWETGEEYLIWQENYVRDFYTMVFSHPSVEAVTWWDIIDGKWLNAPSGLITEEMKPKQAYHALKKLVKHDWWTNASGKTDENGEYRLRAFYGLHSIKAGFNGNEKKIDYYLDKKNYAEYDTVQINI